ncbi:MAG: phosphopantothenoylcysteine decarboxylase, partial [Proteiniphilum sp.]
DDDGITLTLTPNPDIAAALGRVKRKDQLLIGFALETDNEEPNAIRKMERKQLDFIVLNSLRDEGAGFGHDTNKVTIFAHNGAKRSFELQTKREAAKEIIDIAFASS